VERTRSCGYLGHSGLDMGLGSGSGFVPPRFKFRFLISYRDTFEFGGRLTR